MDDPKPQHKVCQEVVWAHTVVTLAIFGVDFQLSNPMVLGQDYRMPGMLRQVAGSLQTTSNA